MIPNQNGDNDSKTPLQGMTPGKGALVSWIVAKIKHSREVRDTLYGQEWDEYTRIWRGMYSKKDKTTDSERSRLIAPATQQAVEMTASEMEEATFGRTAWFDINDDIKDQEKDDAILYRDQLLEDFKLSDVPEAIADTFLLGCVYGTGIALINVEVKTMPSFKGPPTKKFNVSLEAVRPDEFFIDPSGTTIDNAMFCGRDTIKPKFGIKEKQASGVYMKGSLESYSGPLGGSTTGLEAHRGSDPKSDGVLITEYFGKVPAFLLPGAGDDEFGMVEAIVTLANESTVLRAVKSPFTMKDRPIIAYSHDVVPGQFWGRGVVEKGYNVQKALDAELRARIDGLALTTAPMMGADITRMPRNPDLRTRPGKFFLTRGRPSEIIEPIAFQAPGLQATFQNASDLERMVSMATGAMDSATPIGQNRRNETSGGMSQMNAAFLKRSKRTMRRVEKFLGQLITKSLWRYMQFDSGRYAQDAVFKVNGTMGLMAREVENQQLVQMLGFVPPESPAHGIIIQALFQNTNSADKVQLKAAIDEMNKPPTEEEKQEQQQQKQMAMEAQKQELRGLTLENDKLEAEMELLRAKTEHELVKSDLEDDLVEIQAANAATGAEKARMANDQNKVAMARVAVDLKKIDKGDKTK
jgi:hypothetical protein